MSSDGLVLHVPHSSTDIPSGARETFLLNDAELARELLQMTDAYVDELFAAPGSDLRTVCYPVSRLVCDPERFEDDAEEVMAARGMGVIYTATHDLGVLRPTPTAEEREMLLEFYYRPHHRELTAAVAAAIDAHGGCLIIDAHSFPSQPLPYEDDQSAERPEICLGTNAYHTPPRLRVAALKAFSERFGHVALDTPFAGTMVPAEYYCRDRRVRSLMVEVRRDLYMDEVTGEKLPGFEAVARSIREGLQELLDRR